MQINPNRIARVVPPVGGRVAAVEVRLGDAVEQGQALVRIESPDIEAAMSDCLKADAAESESRAALRKAQADFDRVNDLYRYGAIAKKEVVNAEAELARAQAALKDASAAREQTRRKLGMLGLKPCDFGQQVVVRAPISGKVLEINVTPGEFRNDTSAPLMTIADLSTVWVASDVPESVIRWIDPGERVRIELAAYPDEVFEGRVMRVADTVDPRTRTVEVQTELDNRRGRFRPEMFAKIRHAHESRPLPVVPASAVVQAQGRSWVYVELAPGEFERVRVETGEPVGRGRIPVLAGVPAGTRVVVEGAILLANSGGAR